MKIAASPLIRQAMPDLLEIPEPGRGTMGLTLIHVMDWDDKYRFQDRSLRYIVVNSVDEAREMIERLRSFYASGT